MGWIRGELQWSVRRQGWWEQGPRRSCTPTGVHQRANPEGELKFLAAYGPTQSTRDGGKNELSGQPALDGIVKEMPKHEQLFVLIGGNARMGRRGGGRPGSEYCGVESWKREIMASVC